MRVVERSFSDLLRYPNDVTIELDSADVLLRRRGEPDLRLTLAEREADRTATFAMVGRTLRTLAADNPAALEASLLEALPWVDFLPRGDLRVFLDEFSRAVTAAADLDNFTALSQLVREWRHTAEVHSDPRLAARLGRALEADGASIKAPGA